jgi:hypothetical protein
MVKTKVIGAICLVLMGNHIIQTRNNPDKLERQGSCTGDIEKSEWYAALLQKGEEANEDVMDVDVTSSSQCSSDVEDAKEAVVKVDVPSSAQCSSGNCTCCSNGKCNCSGECNCTCCSSGNCTCCSSGNCTCCSNVEDAKEVVVNVDVPSSAQCSSDVEDAEEVVVKVDVPSSPQCSSEVEANVLSSVEWLSTEKESIDSNPVTELYVVQDGAADQVESNNLIIDNLLDDVNDLIDAETEDNSFETIAIVTESNINTKVLKINNPSALMYLINYKQ